MMSASQGICLAFGWNAFSHYPEMNLSGIDKDVRNIRNLFESWGYIVPPIEMNCSYAKFWEEMKNTTRNSGKTIFVVYVSTHGGMISRKVGRKNEESLVFLPSNANMKDEKSLIHADEFIKEVKSIHADRHLIIIDSCHSGKPFLSSVPLQKVISCISGNYLNVDPVYSHVKAGGVAELKRNQPKGSILNNPDFGKIHCTAEGLAILTATSKSQSADASSSGSPFTNSLVECWKSAKSTNLLPLVNVLHTKLKKQAGSSMFKCDIINAHEWEMRFTKTGQTADEKGKKKLGKDKYYFLARNCKISFLNESAIFAEETGTSSRKRKHDESKSRLPAEIQGRLYCTLILLMHHFSFFKNFLFFEIGNKRSRTSSPELRNG